MSTQDLFSERFGELVGRGSQAAVYARGDVAVKVYNPGCNTAAVFYEAAVLGFVEAAGLRTPRPLEVLSVAGQMCLKMSRITGQSFNKLFFGDPDREREWMDELVRLQLEIHRKQIFLPVSQRHRIRDMITVGNLDPVRRQALLAMCDRLPDGDTLCHGDFYFDNIFVDNGAYAVMDWNEAAKGDPLVDASHSYVVLSLTGREVAELYLERFCAACGAEREAILRWVPVMAGSLYGFLPDNLGSPLLQMVDGHW
jgi:aminoglycoside phosphotransferase